MYLAKYDDAGNAIWGVSGAGVGLNFGESVATDASGNVFVVGHFEGETMTIGSEVLSNAGGRDLYVAKVDANGNVLWAASYGGEGDEYAMDVTTDLSGNVYMTGRFKSESLMFGSVGPIFRDAFNLSVDTPTNVFVVKLSGSGVPLWARSAFADIGDGADRISWAEGKGIVCDADGNVFVTGSMFSEHLFFDWVGITATTAVPSLIPSSFVAKFDTDGVTHWLRSFTGRGEDIAADSEGNLYVTGGYTGSAMFANTAVPSGLFGYYGDMFVLKYDGMGNEKWV
ncbi:MAG: hypothetical protein QGG64_12550, partial [Candidatus Latescibacteria bacterium]|nr:hypothetical protein [Candidatus Latescibacterota bacterium]